MINIVAYEPHLQPHFEALNKAWLEEYFTVEPIDAWVLGNPQEAVIQMGGAILFAEKAGSIVGTVALKPLQPAVFELTKMAVDKAWQGLGIGKLLCEAAIRKAVMLGAHRLVLYSETRLTAALRLYQKMGFREIKLEDGKYARANVKMVLDLEKAVKDS